jgi:predicted metallopeptidase
VHGTQKIFSDVFKIEPAYVIELMQPNFGKLSYKEKISRLIIPLLCIPKNFSGETHRKLQYYDYNTKRYKNYTLNDIEKMCDKVIS